MDEHGDDLLSFAVVLLHQRPSADGAILRHDEIG